MRCVCCQSGRIKPSPLGLSEHYQCLACDLIFATAQGNARERAMHHYEEVDPSSEVGIAKQAFFRATLKHLGKHFKKKRGRILDVGCGFGYFLDLAANDGWRTSGVEIIDIAAEGSTGRARHHDIRRCGLKEAKYHGGSFDVITLWDLLVLVDDPVDELKECYRLLKRGGMIGIRVRNVHFQKLIHRIWFPFQRIAWRLGVKKPYIFHRYCYSATSIEILLVRLGFSSIQISNSPLSTGDPYGYASIKCAVSAAKVWTNAVCGIFYRLSAGKWIIGPSLLIWARKP